MSPQVTPAGGATPQELAARTVRIARQLRRFGAGTLRVAVMVARWDVLERVQLQAQALTYDTLLALVPLLAVVFAIFNATGGLARVAGQAQELIVRNLAGSPELQTTIAEYVQRFVANAHAGSINALSIVLLVFSVLSLLGHIEGSFNSIFGVTNRRPLAVRFMTYWAVLTFGPLLLGASFTLTAALQTSHVAKIVGGMGIVKSLLVESTPLVVTWLALTIMYAVVPATRVRLAAALPAAVIAGTLWNVAKYLYAIYVKHAFTMQSIYGSLATIPLFIFWLYVSWLLVLYGAQLAFALEHAATYRREDDRTEMGQAYKERAACRLFLAIARDFYRGRPPTDAEAVGIEMGILRRVASDVIAQLVGAGLVRQTEPEGGLVPAVDLQKVSIAQVLAIMRRTNESGPTDASNDGEAELGELLTELDDHCERTAGSVSFRDLIAKERV